MKVAALISGGKDSIYTLCKMLDAGYDVVCCIYMYNTEEYVDSFMFQTVGHELVKFMEEATGIKFIYWKTKCKVKNTQLNYEKVVGDEVEDLHDSILEAKKTYKAEGVASGAILSNYQRNRVQHICDRLNLRSFTPLWMADQKQLLKEMVDYGIDARLVKIASPAIDKSMLGKSIGELVDYFEKNKMKYNEANYCGEGGEYETIVVDCKYFRKKIRVGEPTCNIHPDDLDKEDQVVYCTYNKVELVDKS